MSLLSSFLANKNGNAFDGGNVIPFATGGVVNRATPPRVAKPKQGDRIRWFGNPLGEPDVAACLPSAPQSPSPCVFGGQPARVIWYTAPKRSA